MLSDVFTTPYAPERSSPDGEARPAARGPRAAGLGLIGTAGLVLALVPIAGWGAGWAPLAAYATGWPVVPPITAATLAVAALGMALQTDTTPRTARRAGALATGTLVVLIAAAVALLAPAAEPADGMALVGRWTETPVALLAIAPSPFTVAALLFLGAAIALLGLERSGAVHGAWLCAAAVVLLALLATTAGSPADAQASGAATRRPVTTIAPAVALVLLLLSSGLLLARRPDGGWWLSGRGGEARLVRAALPGVLVLPPALVWLAQLAEQRQMMATGASRPLLATALVLAMAAVVAHAALQVRRAEQVERERGERRLHRRARREAEHAAQKADRTLRVAADRYRSQLRNILEVSPAPFVALDRTGHLTYLNTAAADLFDCASAAALGRSIVEVWPELGEELRRALGLTVGGATLVRTLESARTGRRFELHGYPDETGIALFIREAGR
ncbi:MAG TPA: PAS domain-containing protein [Gemmatimonadaceae bacterium]|nr:PAS domain-containing protein [Gemmatimonadaceae bacterium]